MKQILFLLALASWAFATGNPHTTFESVAITDSLRVDSTQSRTVHLSGSPLITTPGDSCAWFVPGSPGVIGHTTRANVLAAIGALGLHSRADSAYISDTTRGGAKRADTATYIDTIPGKHVVGGNGTVNYVPLWLTGGRTQGNSLLAEDAGKTKVGIGIIPANYLLEVGAASIVGATGSVAAFSNGAAATAYLAVGADINNLCQFGYDKVNSRILINSASTTNSMDFTINGSSQIKFLGNSPTVGLFNTSPKSLSTGSANVCIGGNGLWRCFATPEVSNFNQIGLNTYLTADGACKFISADYAMLLQMYQGAYTFFNTTTQGTADGAVSWNSLLSIAQTGAITAGNYTTNGVLKVTGGTGLIGSSTNMDSGPVAIGALALGVTNTHTLTTSHAYDTNGVFSVTLDTLKVPCIKADSAQFTGGDYIYKNGLVKLGDSLYLPNKGIQAPSVTLSGSPLITTPGDSCAWFVPGSPGVIGHTTRANVLAAIGALPLHSRADSAYISDTTRGGAQRADTSLRYDNRYNAKYSGLDSGAVTVGTIPIAITNTHTFGNGPLSQSGTVLTNADSLYNSTKGISAPVLTATTQVTANGIVLSKQTGSAQDAVIYAAGDTGQELVLGQQCSGVGSIFACGLPLNSLSLLESYKSSGLLIETYDNHPVSFGINGVRIANMDANGLHVLGTLSDTGNLSATGNIAGNGNLTTGGSVKVSSLGAGIGHYDASGNLTSSALTESEMSASVNGTSGNIAIFNDVNSVGNGSTANLIGSVSSPSLTLQENSAANNLLAQEWWRNHNGGNLRVITFGSAYGGTDYFNFPAANETEIVSSGLTRFVLGSVDNIPLVLGSDGYPLITIQFGQTSIKGNLYDTGNVNIVSGSLCGIPAGTIPMGSATTGLAASNITETGICDNMDSLHLTNGATIAGPVGIGTTSPQRLLHINNTGVNNSYNGLCLTYGGSTVDGAEFTYSNVAGTVVRLDSKYDDPTAVMNFRMRTAGTAVNAITILGSGNVGIGTTSPAMLLDIQKATATYGDVAQRLMAYGNNVYPPYFYLAKSRGTSVGSLVTTQTNDILGIIAANGVSTSNTVAAAAGLYFVQDGAATSTYVPTQFQWWNYGTQLMTLTSGGYLGIGTTSPNTTLDVNGGISLGRIKVLTAAYSSSPYAMLATDGTLVFTNADAGSTQYITLQSAASYPGRILTLMTVAAVGSSNVPAKLLSNAGNDVILISGGSAQGMILWNAVNSDYSVTMQSDGTYWRILHHE